MLLKLYTDDHFDFYYSAKEVEDRPCWEKGGGPLSITNMCYPSKTDSGSCKCPSKKVNMEMLATAINKQRETVETVKSGVLSKLSKNIQTKNKKGKNKVTLAEYTRQFRLEKLIEVYGDSMSLLIQFRGWYGKMGEELSEEHGEAIKNGIRKISQQTGAISRTFQAPPPVGALIWEDLGLPLEKKITILHEGLENLLSIYHSLAVYIWDNDLLGLDDDVPHIELPDISLLTIRLPQKYVFTQKTVIKVTEMAH